MISLHQTSSIIKKYKKVLLILGVVLFVLLLIAVVRNPSRKNPTQIVTSTKVTYTPYPVQIPETKTPSPDQSYVSSTKGFESYIVDNSMKEIVEDKLPADFMANPTRAYYSTDKNKPGSLLRLTKANNASERTLQEYVDEEKVKLVDPEVRYTKYRGYYSATIIFKGADLRSYGQTTIVSIGPTFYVFTYIENMQERTKEETLNSVSAYMDEFLRGYDWRAVKVGTENFESEYDFDTAFQNELDLRKATPPEN